MRKINVASLAGRILRAVVVVAVYCAFKVLGVFSYQVPAAPLSFESRLCCICLVAESLVQKAES
jgi:hypothetical protein